MQPVSDTSQPAPGHLSSWSGPSSCFATEMKNSSWATVSGSSHASLRGAYKAVWGCLLGCCTERRNILLDVGPHLESTLSHINILYPSVRTTFHGEHCGPCEFNKVSSRRAGVSWNSCHRDRMGWPNFQPDSFAPFWRPPWTMWGPQLPIFRSCGNSSELRSFVRSV